MSRFDNSWRDLRYRQVPSAGSIRSVLLYIMIVVLWGYAMNTTYQEEQPVKPEVRCEK